MWRNQWGICIIVLVALAVGLIGCSLSDDQEYSGPTEPSPENGQEAANFYTRKGDNDGYGVYKRPGILVVNVPQAGDYVVTYKTELGIFNLIFRAPEASMLNIGLHKDDEVMDVTITEVEITAEAPQNAVYEIYGNVFVFSYPGDATPLHTITNLPIGTMGYTLLFNPPPPGFVVVVVVQNGVIEDDVEEIPEDTAVPPPCIPYPESPPAGYSPVGYPPGRCM